MIRRTAPSWWGVCAGRRVGRPTRRTRDRHGERSTARRSARSSTTPHPRLCRPDCGIEKSLRPSRRHPSRQPGRAVELGHRDEHRRCRRSAHPPGRRRAIVMTSSSPEHLRGRRPVASADHDRRRVRSTSTSTPPATSSLGFNFSAICEPDASTIRWTSPSTLRRRVAGLPIRFPTSGKVSAPRLGGHLRSTSSTLGTFRRSSGVADVEVMSPTPSLITSYAGAAPRAARRFARRLSQNRSCRDRRRCRITTGLRVARRSSPRPAPASGQW